MRRTIIATLAFWLCSTIANGDSVRFTDSFSSPAALSSYTILTGSWSVSGGALLGFFPITGTGQTDPQGDILFPDTAQPRSSDWKVSFDFNYQLAQSGYTHYDDWASLILYISPTEKYQVVVGDGGWNWDGAPRSDIAVRAQRFSPWSEYLTTTAPLNWTPRATNHVEFAKVGNDVRVSVNGTYLASVSVPFNGRTPMLGFHVYGTVLFDNLEIDEVTDGMTDVCAESIAVVQSQLDTANSQLAAALAAKQSLQTQVEALQQQLADLQIQLSNARAANTSLEQQLETQGNQVQTLTATAAQLTSQNNSLTAANAQLNSQLVGLSLENQRLAEQVAQLTAANAQLTSANTAFQAQLALDAKQLQALTAQNSQLTATNDRLANQNTSLLAQIDVLNAATSATTAELARLSQALGTVFNNPTFQIPGTTLQDQVRSLSTAIANLNYGQRQALYINLGGTK